ncbi:von Willebrand factor type A domain-containing protein [Mycena alexandri]|uniref:von Willebrand factor type A domain-containing protein n=1 Tax=Mycena alexandri TaxID=1745969 RepID=A0AAD6RW63_9AGAR|nr:von Willebrand factor type A domain-containing protein [Mycena alexandri]
MCLQAVQQQLKCTRYKPRWLLSGVAIPMYGLYYTHRNQVLYLPLLGVRAEASIKELAAQVKLTQVYGNDRLFPIEASYSFSIPARASVCGFFMVKQDGTRVVGTVLEKQEARKTYNTAVAKGQLASLMEQQTPDIFQVSVGNIPPDEQVQIELVYATELAEDEENDSIRFHLPFHIGARYGSAPAPLTRFTSTSAITSKSTPFLIINASVEAVAPIAKISSPSHTTTTELGPDPALPNFKELPFSHYARVSLSSNSPLTKDFVLTVKSAGLDAPRCVAEPHPTHNTAALTLTLVPRFTLPDLARQEFILLVDRSGSMSNKRISAARKALVVLLRALPHQDSLFQIVSFGSTVSELWQAGSRAYNQATLEEATRHVDGMDANYGGTEIRQALAKCFRIRARDRPTSVLVLTDGEAYDVDGVLAEVSGAVKAAQEGAPLRVSVLGIGNSVSTAMCEGIARVGHGACMLVTEEETTFTGKVARLLQAARTPLISNITVDWGRPELEDEFELVGKSEKSEKVVEQKSEEKQKSLNIFDEAVDPTHLDKTGPPSPPRVILPPPSDVQQSPFKIRNLFPGTRVNIYAILQGRSSIPQTVTLHGSTPDGASISLPVPVTVSRLPSTPALHALAARKIIQDLEDGQHAVALTATLKDPGDMRASIVRLGTTYSITSTYTSFVAVDEVPGATRASPPENTHQAPPPYVRQASQPPAVDSFSANHWITASSAVDSEAYSSSRRPSAWDSYDPTIEDSTPWTTSEEYGMPSRVHTAVVAPPPSVSSSTPRKAVCTPLPHRLFLLIQENIPVVQPVVQPQAVQSYVLSSRDYDPTVEDVPWRGQEEYGSPSPPAAQTRGTADIYSAPMRDSGPIAYKGKKSNRLSGLFSTRYLSRTGSTSASVTSASEHQAYSHAVHSLPARPLISAPQQSGESSPKPTTKEDSRLEALARLQSFDGAFPASQDVLSVTGLTLKEGKTVEDVRLLLPKGAREEDQVLASVLAMVFALERVRASGGQADRDAWVGMYDKVRAWLESVLQGRGVVRSLEEKVAALLA